MAREHGSSTGSGSEREQRRRPHRARRILIGVLVLIVAGGGFGYWYVFVRDDEEAVDVNQVERDFDGGGRSTKAGAPKAGVYLYTTKGTESVSALGGQTHTYPATTTLTVTATDCGVTARWDVLTGRYDQDQRCLGSDGSWTLTERVVADEFFNNSEVDTYTCTDLTELPTNPVAGTKTSGTCVDGENTLTYDIEVVGTETLTVGGTKVTTVHQSITFTEGGQRSGGGTEHRWVQEGTNLLVRSQVKEKDDSPSPVGSVTYEQQYEIELQSLTPRT